MEDRVILYDVAIKCLAKVSQANIHLVKIHVFKLKVNDEFVITSKEQIKDLVSFINRNYD